MDYVKNCLQLNLIKIQLFHVEIREVSFLLPLYKEGFLEFQKTAIVTKVC